MALCPVCRNALPEAPAEYCPNCGASLASTEGVPRASDAGGAPPLPPLGSAPPSPPPLPPTSPGASSGGHRGRTAWDDRDRVGLLTALVETTRDVLGSPTRFFRAMPVKGGVGSPLLYAVILGWAGLVVTALYQTIFRSIVGMPFAGFGDRPELTAIVGWTASWAGFVAQAVFGGVSVVIAVFLCAGILHVTLLLVGGARRDFEATFRVVCFAEATSLVFLVPFCGQLIGFFWTIALWVIGLSQAHETGAGKAAAAVLLPLVLVCCCCGGALALFAGALASLVPGAVGP